MTSPVAPLVVAPNGTDLKGLFTAYDTSFANLKSDNSTMYQDLAFVPGGAQLSAATFSRGESKSGNGRMAQFMRYPFPMMGKPPKRWEWGDVRKAGPAALAYIEMELIRWAPDDEEQYYDLLDAETFGIIQNDLSMMLDRAPKSWDYMLADEVNSNTAAYDGISYFTPKGSEHPANPTNLNLGGFYNDIQIPAINVSSLRSAVSLLERVPGFDGQPLDTGTKTKIIAVAPNSDIEMQLLDIFQGTIQVQSLNAASAATGPNEGLRGKADVKLWKDLRRGNPLVAPVNGIPSPPAGVRSGLGVDDVFYLFSVPSSLQRAMILYPKRHPTQHYQGLNPNDPNRIDTGGVRYGYYIFGGAKMALPQRGLRVQITG